MIACIEDPVVTRHILSQVEAKQGVKDSMRESSHRVEGRRILVCLGKHDFIDSISGIESLSWRSGYCLLGVRNPESGAKFRMLPVKIG